MGMEGWGMLGFYGRDKITGFHGRVTGFCRYITGCDQLCLTPLMKDDGTMPDGRWFDIHRIEIDQSKGHVNLDRDPHKGSPIGGGEQAPAYA